MARCLPISMKEFSSKLSSLVAPNSPSRSRLGVAVSGGPDSMALCTLLKYHRDTAGWPKELFAYTIDHGVRPESKEEAKTVAQYVTALGFNHRIIELRPWSRKEYNRHARKDRQADIETLLRTARIDLLSEAAKSDSLSTVLTAHHQDDQYETIIQRMAWGSTLVGLAGIPAANGLFRRPLLEYPKARLKATCEMYNISWVIDPTNSDPTYALRNAIRKIVENQDDLPAALRKENILALSERGANFRTKLLAAVNDLLNECTFKRSTYSGSVVIEFQRSLYESPIRVLQHFVAAVARVLKTGKLEPFVLLGVQSDMASNRAIKRLGMVGYKDFNIFGVQFIRQHARRAERWRFMLTPENVRRGLRKTHVELIVPDGPEDTWKQASFLFPSYWWLPWEIDVEVLKDRKYYFRHLNKRYDVRLIEKIGTGTMRYQMKKVIKWLSLYPKLLMPVLCHIEPTEKPNKMKEIVDAIPHFRIVLSNEVRVTSHGKFDLREHEVWEELRMGRVSDEHRQIWGRRGNAYHVQRDGNYLLI